MTKGTSSLAAAMTLLYFRSFDLAFIAAAAPGNYERLKPDPLTNPFEGLFASIVVTSIRMSLLLILHTRSIRLLVEALKQKDDSSSTCTFAALQSFVISSMITLCFL